MLIFRNWLHLLHSVVRLQVDWVLPVRSHIHRCLVSLKSFRESEVVHWNEIFDSVLGSALRARL